MALFKKIRNNVGDVIELPEGQELSQELDRISKSDEFKKSGGSLREGNSSLLFRSFLTSQGITWADAKRALDPAELNRSVGELFTNTNTELLFPTMVEEYVRGAYEKTGRANELLMGSVPMDQQTSSFFYADNPEDEELDFNLIAQGAPIPVTTIKLADKKSIQVYKRGGGIEWTDEAKSMKIDMLAAHLKRRGARLGRVDEKLAIDSLVNGYFDDGFDSAPVIGVKKTGEIDLVDMWFATVHMNEVLEFDPNRVIMNRKMAEMWVSTVRKDGAFIFFENLMNGTTPNVIKSLPMISDQLPDGQMMFLDTNFALQEYIYKELSTENDRNPKTQVEGSYTTKTAGYVPFEKNARLIVDINQTRP